MNELREAIATTAKELGIDPIELATAFSYETAGTFDPWQKGPKTKWGRHRGLIQWGEPQRAKYGVDENTSIADQVKAAGRYLVDAGVKPGHKLLDIYSAINAGSVGKYDASDEAAGGAPGTVRDKVETQMAGHRTKAEKLMMASADTAFDPFKMGAKRKDAGTFDPFKLGAVKKSEQNSDIKVTPGRKSTNIIDARQPANPEEYGDVLDVAVGQGILMGAGDELAAGLSVPRRMIGRYREGKPLDISDAYDEGLGVERARVANFRGRNPVGSVVAELGGGLATGLATAPAAAANVLGRVGQGIALGAGYGGAYGFNSGEGGVENRLTSGIKGAVSGAAIGMAIPSASAAVGKAYNTLADLTVRPAMNALRSSVNPQGNAVQLAQRSLRRDGLTPDAASAKMQEAVDAGDDTMMLMDVAGDNTRRLGRFATNIPGQGAEKIKSAVFDRQLAQPERVTDAVKKGLDDPERYFSTVDDIIAQRQTASKPLYDEAFAQPVPYTRKLEALLGRGKVMRDALRKASEMADAEGVPFKQFFAQVADDGSFTVQRVPDTRAWDLIKRSLDDIIQENTEFLPNGAEKLTNMGRIVAGIKREMVSEIDQLNPAYAKARAAYSSASESLEAVTKGKQLLDADPEMAKRMLREMSEGDRQLARLGVSKALVDRIQRVKDGANTVRAIFASPKQRAIFKEIFPSKESFAEFEQTMQREGQKTRTKHAIQGNSTTAQQVTDLADNQVDMGVIGNLLTGKLGAAAGAVVQKALARATVVNEATAKEVAEILTTTDPAVSQQIISQMQKLAMRDERVSRNWFKIRAALRNAGVVGSTKETTDAFAPPRVLGQTKRQPMEITVPVGN